MILRWNLDNKLENRLGLFDPLEIILSREREREGRPSGKNEIGTKVSREKRLG